MAQNAPAIKGDRYLQSGLIFHGIFLVYAQNFSLFKTWDVLIAPEPGLDSHKLKGALTSYWIGKTCSKIQGTYSIKLDTILGAPFEEKNIPDVKLLCLA